MPELGVFLSGYCMFRLYKFIKYFLHTIYRIIVDVPQVCVKFQQTIRAYWSLVKYRLAHLRDTNIQLGVMHMEAGRVTDALLRFYIIDKWIAPHNTEVQYYKAWCYFLQYKFAKASLLFNSSKYHDSREIAKFIDIVERGAIIDIPYEMYCSFQDFTLAHLKPHAHHVLTGQYLAELLLEYLDEIPEECSFLEIGSNGATVAQLVRGRIAQGLLQYDVVEIAHNRNALAASIELNGHAMYDNVYADIDKVDQKYDMIFSVYGLNRFVELQDHLQQISLLLKPSGHIILAHRVEQNTGIDLKYLMLLHDQISLKNNLKLANLQIESINIEQIDNVQCAFVVCHL